MKKIHKAVLSAAFPGVFFFACIWLYAKPGVVPKPVTLSYCYKFDQREKPPFPCTGTKVLRIPAGYYGQFRNRDINPADDQYLIVAFPSMKPWADLSGREQMHEERLKIVIRGVTTQTVKDVFAINRLGLPASAPERILPGLERYDRGEGQGMDLIEEGKFPRVTFYCPHRPEEPRADRYLCNGITYTSWYLKLDYFQPQHLLLQWKEVRQKIIALIDSFSVIP